jgi:hypothetical protein
MAAKHAKARPAPVKSSPLPPQTGDIRRLKGIVKPRKEAMHPLIQLADDLDKDIQVLQVCISAIDGIDTAPRTDAGFSISMVLEMHCLEPLQEKKRRIENLVRRFPK